MGGPHPLERGRIQRLRLPAPLTANVEKKKHVPLASAGARESRWSKAGFLGLDAEFLAKLANQRGFGEFPLIDFSAGEFPKPFHVAAGRTLLEEDSVVPIDQRRGNHQRRRIICHQELSLGFCKPVSA